MMRTTRSIIAVAAILGTTGLLEGRAALAQTDVKVQRAANFLGTTKRGKDILSYLHFGGTYVNHQLVKAMRVSDKTGQELPGHVAIRVVFDWETSFGENTTSATIFFDEMGDPYEIQCAPSDTTSIISQPFALANGTIQVLGNIILAAAGDQMSAQEKADMQKAINNQDARQLLIDTMRVQKRLGL